MVQLLKYLEIPAFHLHVDQTVSAEQLMDRVYAHAYQITLAAHQLVDQSVL